MRLIDTHTHLYLPEFDNDRDEMVERAVRSGVIKLLMPNIDAGSVEKMKDAEERYPGICYSMIGLHPTSVKEDYQKQLEILQEQWLSHRYVAVGEVGIDLYWDRTFIKEQMKAFKSQIIFSLENKMPLVIHSRESFAEVFSVLEEFRGEPLKGVLHAFTGSSDDAQKAISLGFMLGIGGIVTFKNSGLDKIVADVGPGNLVLETDSPYLAPVPYRGKRNESSYLCIINRKIAELVRMSEEKVAEITFSNSEELFKLKE